MLKGGVLCKIWNTMLHCHFCLLLSPFHNFAALSYLHTLAVFVLFKYAGIWATIPQVCTITPTKALELRSSWASLTFWIDQTDHKAGDSLRDSEVKRKYKENQLQERHDDMMQVALLQSLATQSSDTYSNSGCHGDPAIPLSRQNRLVKISCNAPKVGYYIVRVVNG